MIIIIIIINDDDDDDDDIFKSILFYNYYIKEINTFELFKLN
jgi:hypothetical protein